MRSNFQIKLFFKLLILFLFTCILYATPITNKSAGLFENNLSDTGQLEKAPVIVFSDTLFNVYGTIGSFTAKERAKSIENRIEALAEDYPFESELIQLLDSGNFLNIMYNREILMSVDSLQAAQEDKSRIEVAEFYRTKIIDAIVLRQYNTSWQKITLQIIGALLIILVEVGVIKKIKYCFRRLKVSVWLQRGKGIKGLMGIIDDQRAVQNAIIFLKYIQTLVTLIILYLGLLAIFKLSPYTKHLSDQLLHYVIAPLKIVNNGIVNYLPKLFTVLVIFLIFRYIRKSIRKIAERIALNKIVIKGFYPDWAFPTYNLISGLLYIFMFILIFPYLPHSDSKIFQGVSVFTGIMVSLGSSSVMGNLVAGFVITYMRPFKVGDRIKLGEHTGDVLEKTALVTRIKTPKNEVITIPNSNVMSAQTVNYSQSAKDHGLILFITVAVGYDVPWKKVHEMLYEVAHRTENVLKRQRPFILQDQFGEFDVDYQLNVYIKDAKLTAKIYSDLRQHTQDVFAENKIHLVTIHQNINRNVDGIDPYLVNRSNETPQ